MRAVTEAEVLLLVSEVLSWGRALEGAFTAGAVFEASLHADSSY